MLIANAGFARTAIRRNSFGPALVRTLAVRYLQSTDETTFAFLHRNWCAVLKFVYDRVHGLTNDVETTPIGLLPKPSYTTTRRIVLIRLPTLDVTTLSITICSLFPITRMRQCVGRERADAVGRCAAHAARARRRRLPRRLAQDPRSLCEIRSTATRAGSATRATRIATQRAQATTCAIIMEHFCFWEFLSIQTNFFLADYCWRCS